MERQEEISALTMDGCPVEELGLVFTLPSYPYIKLRKGAGESLSSALLSYVLSICLQLMSSPSPRKMTVSLGNLGREGFNSVFPISRSLADTCYTLLTLRNTWKYLEIHVNTRKYTYIDVNTCYVNT